MLRMLLLLAALALTLGGLVLRRAGDPAGTPMAIWGAVLTVAVLVERWRYRAPDSLDAGPWQPTDERFIDPETGQLMEVWFSPRTGARRYLVARNEARSGDDGVAH